MHYEILLFDVDNTLLDFTANEAESFRSLLWEKGEPYSEEIYKTYSEMNEEMWRAIERQEKTVEEVVNIRFSKLMSQYGKIVDGADWERTYRSYLNQGIQKIAGVDQVLARLQKNHRLYVITNGVRETQESRMTRSGLSRYVLHSFISEEVGAGKPAQEFFDYVKAHISGFDRKKALIIGDSLTSDILGGNLAGIDTCWFCRKKGQKPLGATPDYIIHQLEDLYPILGEV